MTKVEVIARCGVLDRNRKWIIAVLFVGTLSTSGHAAVKIVNNEAIQAMTAGDPAKAQEMLSQAYRRGEFDHQTLFLLAMTNKELGQYDHTERYLTELLLRDPDSGRVKLELAEAVFRNGRPQEAKALLYEVKMTNPPGRIGETIDEFIAFIESGMPRVWTAFASIGQIYDTNVNQGPDIDTVLIYDLPFELDSNARRSHDWATVIRTGANYNRVIDSQWAVQAGVNVGSTDYHELDDFDGLSLSMWAGPSWRNGDWSFSVPYVFNVIRLGHKESYYQIANGLAPQFGYEISPRWQLQGTLSWQDKRYKTNSDRDSRATTFSPAVRYLLDSSSYLTVGGYLSEELSGVRTSSNLSDGVSLSYFRQLDQNWTAQLSSAISRTDYRGVEVAFGERRRDQRYNFGFNVGYRIEQWDTRVGLDHSYTNNRSSIDLYGYKHSQTLLNLIKLF